jgi:nitrogen fixation protein NifU and related proteins
LRRERHHGNAGAVTDPRALYQATIVKHDREPLHEGPLANATHVATVDNPLCGDVVTIRIVVEHGIITDAAFEARGCSLARAGASIATSRAIGNTAMAMRELAATVEQLVGAAPDAPIPPDLGELEAFVPVRAFKSRRSCACLAFRAIDAALR